MPECRRAVIWVAMQPGDFFPQAYAVQKKRRIAAGRTGGVIVDRRQRLAEQPPPAGQAARQADTQPAGLVDGQAGVRAALRLHHAAAIPADGGGGGGGGEAPQGVWLPAVGGLPPERLLGLQARPTRSQRMQRLELLQREVHHRTCWLVSSRRSYGRDGRASSSPPPRPCLPAQAVATSSASRKPVPSCSSRTCAAVGIVSGGAHWQAARERAGGGLWVSLALRAGSGFRTVSPVTRPDHHPVGSGSGSGLGADIFFFAFAVAVVVGSGSGSIR